MSFNESRRPLGSFGPILGWATAITLAGASFRFFMLNRYPVGFYFDEAVNSFDIFALGRGYHPIWFVSNNGREPLFFYWSAIFVRPLISSPYAIRVGAAFLGVLTIPAIFFCVSQMLRETEGPGAARRIALAASAVGAFLFVHVMFSRTGLRTISLPLMECLSFGVLWQAARLRDSNRFLLGGALLGLTLYTYTAARLLVAGALLYALYGLSLGRAIYWRGLALMTMAASAIAAPLLVYAISHPTEFFQRTDQLATTDLSRIAGNGLAVLAMFNVHGTNDPRQNIPGMPMFDFGMGVMFVLGALLCACRLKRPPYAFCLIWLICIIPASALTPDAPDYGRLTGLIPPAVLLVALGLADLPKALTILLRRAPGVRWMYARSVALVVASAGMTFHNYFQIWGPSKEAFYAFGQEKVDGSAELMRWVDTGAQVFLAHLYALDLAHLYALDWTYKFLTRASHVQSFEAADCTVFPPSGRDGVYVYPYYDRDQPRLLLSHLPGDPEVKEVANSRGEPGLIVIREKSADVPLSPRHPLGTFGDVALDDAQVLPAVVHPGDTVVVTLRWRALRRVPDDYTAYVHADDNEAHRRLQRDSLPCGAHFGSSLWLPGEQVGADYAMVIPPDVPSGIYKVTTGLYKAPGLPSLKLDGTADSDLELTSFTVSH